MNPGLRVGEKLGLNLVLTVTSGFVLAVLAVAIGTETWPLRYTAPVAIIASAGLEIGILGLIEALALSALELRRILLK